MTRILSAVTITRPIDVVFEYVTTPANWLLWHPSSLAVTGDAGHSLLVGEQVEEAFNVAGRHGRVVWTVTERQAPRRWVIDGTIIGGGGGVVSYTLSPAGAATRFEREFVYPLSSPLIALLDRLYVRRRIEAESAEAVRRLKEVLEKGSAEDKTMLTLGC